MRTYSRKKVEHKVIEGVKELCRLCLEKCEEVVPIFTDSSDVCAALPMRIMTCVGLEMVREDCLPNIMCRNCYKELERCYRFRKRCEVTYLKLKAHVMAMKEQEANKNLKKKDDDEQKEGLLLPNGDGVEQLVFALNGNEQLEMVDVSLDRVEQVCQEQDPFSGEVLQQNVENKIQMQDISTTCQSQSNNSSNEADMSLLLSSILIRLGILNQQGQMLEVVDRSLQEVELEAGDGQRVILELVEEDELTVQSTDAPSSFNEVTLSHVENGRFLQHTLTEVQNSTQQQKVISKPQDPLTKVTVSSPRPAKSTISTAWCDICGKLFSSRSVLARHRRVHSAHRPHACEVCGRMFLQKACLKRHELVHLENRPFKCPSCPKSFTQRSALTSHERAHTPPHARSLALHRCSVCCKVFLYKSGLSRHMSVHAGRVYTCHECNKQFKDKSALMRHVKNSEHRGKGT